MFPIFIFVAVITPTDRQQRRQGRMDGIVENPPFRFPETIKREDQSKNKGRNCVRLPTYPILLRILGEEELPKNF